jgi:hypothetical protein
MRPERPASDIHKRTEPRPDRRRGRPSSYRTQPRSKRRRAARDPELGEGPDLRHGRGQGPRVRACRS